ncbi:hypothetical protein ACK2MR_08080 [Providencia hangzhouensis]|uniref:hypothetical protein n=1 Tax=Providencia TaxID=586 RepID=UPI00234AF47C|nr:MULTISPECIES: hypothetical protein [unclassified Providencia]
MFNEKRNIRIEVSDNKKVIELRGYTEKEAHRLIDTWLNKYSLVQKTNTKIKK